MRYVGGKSRIAKDIAEAILQDTDHRVYYMEPFLGGGASLEKLGPHFKKVIACDLQEDLILMWQALQKGWTPPTFISEEDYKVLRHSEPSPERGFIGFAGSFGGKWFGGYARGKDGKGKDVNYLEAGARSLQRTMDALHDTEVRFLHCSYIDRNPPPGIVVYCDPPYEGTLGYGKSAGGGFDHEQFWRVMTAWAEKGVHVYVSEYNAPEGWEPIWEKKHRRTIALVEQGRPETLERLFTKRV